jgi:hypothetical protein
MTLDQLRQAHQAQPFHPFRIYLADGRELDAPHPEFMYIPPRNQRTFTFTHSNGLMEWIDLLLVTSIEQLNGTGRRRRSA